MPPTIFMSNERDIDHESGEDVKQLTVLKRKIPDAENVGQKMCVKRKLDDSNFNDAECHKIKKQRKISDSTTSTTTSSRYDSDDDYGTDSELIAIDQNKHKNLLCRYSPVTNYGNHDNAVDRVEKVIKNSVKMCHPINEVGSRYEDDVKKYRCSKISNANTRHLLEMAIATFRLSRMNKELQTKLIEFQADTRNFLKSVLENPENKEIKERLKFSI